MLTSLVLAGFLAATSTWTHAQQRGAAAVAIDADDIGGVVTGPKGPEAGVWVVAETTDTPTRFIRTVVTDDQGRYVVPDLPRAKYQVFVRGYGLVDSPKVGAAPGQQLNLQRGAGARRARGRADLSGRVLAEPDGDPERRDARARSTLGRQGVPDLPPGRQPGARARSRKRLARSRTRLPLGITACRSARWVWPMSGSFQRFGEQRRMFADWTDQIAAGAVPKQVPPRPSGLERNVVVTLWDWAVPTGGRSDGAASDDRIGTNNANGPIWGVIQSDDLLVSIDPVANRAEQIVVPTSAGR